MNGKMPEMDGWQATRLLRAKPENKNVPIFATIAMLQPSEIQRSIDAVCNDYIIKLFTADELLRRIRALIH